MRRILIAVWSITLIVLAGCVQEEQAGILVSLVADGHERAWYYSEPVTVQQFLQEADIEVDYAMDRVNPERWTQIYDGIRITIVRVDEEEYCEENDIPFRQQTRFVEGLEQERIGQAGRNGIQQVCYRVRIEDGVRRDPVEISRVELVSPQDEIIYVPPTGELDPVPITGTLAYISNGNAWVMRGSSANRRPLTVTSDLDSRVFSLSPDGRQLLIARTEDNDGSTFNRLWLITDTTSETGEPVQLIPQDVLYAEWVPGHNHTISYSTFESRQAPPGWQALNDLWIMRIDPQTGDQINIDQILDRSPGGLYGWWGTTYRWSPDGEKLAYVRADAVGLVDLDDGRLEPPLLEYAVLNTLQDWSWRATVSWSPDGDLILTTVHGPPYGNEPPENSPIFNIAVSAADGGFSADIVERAGIWSTPRFSPHINDEGNPFPRGYMAYLRARDWEASISSEYDLVVADRDGSNARVIFPRDGQPGLAARQFAQDFVWSPDGRQLAFVYLGNLWVIDVESGIAHQLTQDGGASKPVWTR
jgi:resuscitation-promoting factor RpfB